MANNVRKKAAANGKRPDEPSNSNFPIVGIGASAGGIEAFTALLKSLPDSPGIGFVFVLHQAPTHTSNLVQILSRVTRMPVDLVRAGMHVQPNRIYVAPADAEVSIDNGTLHLHERAAGAPSVIDGFFRSLAEDQGSRAISVVLSGSASDGAFGTKAIKAEGGITFAQDGSAKVDSMPRSAAVDGIIDFVLSPEEIAKELVAIGKHDYLTRGEDEGPRLPESDLKQLFTMLRAKHDLDLTHYKPSTIERRIRRRMALNKVDSLREYLPVVRKNPAEIEHLYADILIRVTGFFRDPAVFEALRREVVPELVRRRSSSETIRVWVPGCATGEEVYSLAMALQEASSDGTISCPMQIFGTDVSESAIERARAGMYPESIASEVGAERLRRFFSHVNGGYRVSKTIRDCCVFARQNVTKDPPFSKLDLISCRNVMIYFGTTLQKKVLSVFHYALRPDGFLLLGSSESIGSFDDLFDIADRKNKIYRKKAVKLRPVIDFNLERSNVTEPHDAHEPPEMPAAGAVFRDADRVLLSRFTPPGVLINDDMEVLQFRGRTSRYLEPPSGAASFNILKMAREGLLADLRSAIYAARKKDAPERREGIRVKVNDHSVNINIEAIPFVGASKERFILVLFEEPDQNSKTRRSKKQKPAPPETGHSGRLKRELEATREYLQSIIEEQEAMNEELRSANEEIQSSNEELQSTNEELETAKEELQSSNEELMTLNDELENRNQELALANNDLINLLSAVDIPIVMLDGNLRIRRFNPGAQRSWNLISTDIGRSINEIKTSLRLENLDQVVAQVIESLEVKELEIHDRSGRSHSLRIRPYKTTDNKIDGAVLVLVDLEEFRTQPGVH
jgi:two-component system CheB/CheR fusion protein